MRITTAAAASFVTSAPPLAVPRRSEGDKDTNSNTTQEERLVAAAATSTTSTMEDEVVIGESRSGIRNKRKNQDKDTQDTTNNNNNKGYKNVREVVETPPPPLQEETKGAADENSISRMEEEEPRGALRQEEEEAFEVQHHISEDEGLEDYSHASQFIGTGVSILPTPKTTSTGGDTTVTTTRRIASTTTTKNAVIPSQSEDQGPPQAQTQQHMHDSDSAAISNYPQQQPHQQKQQQQQQQQQQHPQQQELLHHHKQQHPPTQSSTINTHAAANVSSMLEAAGFGSIGHGGGGGNASTGQHGGGQQQQHHTSTTYSSDSTSPEFQWSERTKRLAKDLEEFVERGLDGIMASERGDVGAPNEEAVADLQLQTARMLRTVLPTNRDLLHLVQEKNWMPLLLSWLNLHDRPAVQVEALLALTSIADLCQQAGVANTAAAAAAGAAAAFQNAGFSPTAAAGAAEVALAHLNATARAGVGTGGGIDIGDTGTSNTCSSNRNTTMVNGNVNGNGSGGTAAGGGTSGSTSSGGGLYPSSTLTAAASAGGPFPWGLDPSNPAAMAALASSDLGLAAAAAAAANHTSQQVSGGQTNNSNGDNVNMSQADINNLNRAYFSNGMVPPLASQLPITAGPLATNPIAKGTSVPPMAAANSVIDPMTGVPYGHHAMPGNGVIHPSHANFPFTLPPLNASDSNPNDNTIAPPTTSSNRLTNMNNPNTNSNPVLPLNAGDQIPSAIISALSNSFPAPPQQSLGTTNGTNLTNANTAIHPMSGGSYAPPAAPNAAPLQGAPLSTNSQHLLLRHADAIPTLISLLSSPNREVHEQAMWILGSIAAGEAPASPGINVNTAVAGGSGSTGGTSIPGSSGNGDLDKFSNASAKEVVLAAGVMDPLLKCLDDHPQNLSLQRIGSWAISSLVETKLQPKAGKTTPVTSESSPTHDIDVPSLLPTLQRLLNSTDHEVLSYTCWALSHLCDGPSSHIAAVVTSPDPRDVPGGLVPRLVDLLLHNSWRVTKPALRTIGNIVCAECIEEPVIPGVDGSMPTSSPASTDFTEVILDCEAVPRLKLLITHSNREIQKEACWTLSNIAAGTVDQIQAVIDSDAIPPLVQLVNDKKTDQEVKSEACWVVLNATSCGSDQQIEVLVSEGCVSVLGLLLEETSMVTMALEGLERVLQVEENREAARRERALLRKESNKSNDSDGDEESQGNSPLVSASLIEKALTKHNSSSISKRARRIWEDHFVSCALCQQSYSKHRASDAKFCKECKCYVCSNCNCEKYHLSYQEELWAEEKFVPKQSKKSKKQKKKEKRKEKNKSKQQEKKAASAKGRTVAISSSAANISTVPVHSSVQTIKSDTLLNKKEKSGGKISKPEKKGAQVKPSNVTEEQKDPILPSLSVVSEDEATDDLFAATLETDQPPIDFALYLQQTGSIIALARLMDALDEGNGYDVYDDNVLQSEGIFVRSQQ